MKWTKKYNKSEIPHFDVRFWTKSTEHGQLGSVLDTKDSKGIKNEYIDILQKIALAQRFIFRGDEIVLDFGCGTGRFTDWLAQQVHHVVGLEVTPAMLEITKKNVSKENVSFILYDGLTLPFEEEKFDAIVSVGVLQDIYDKTNFEELIDSFSKCLKPERRVYLIEQVSKNRRSVRKTPEDFLTAFERHGFECVCHYPIRAGRWLILYLIRYGFIPKSLLPPIARFELFIRKINLGPNLYYKDYLFEFKKIR